MFYKFFDKKTSGEAARPPQSETLPTQATGNKSAIKIEIMSNKELAEELHKLIIRNFEKRKVHSSFIENIWDADIVDMKLISKFNKGSILLTFIANMHVLLL